MAQKVQHKTARRKFFTTLFFILLLGIAGLYYVTRPTFAYCLVCENAKFVAQTKYEFKIRTLDPNHDTDMSYDLLKYGTYDGEQVEAIQLATNDDENCLVIDVGAQIGYYALVAANKCDKVLAFEHAAPYSSMLQYNVHLNKVEHKIAVKPFHIAQVSRIQDHVFALDDIIVEEHKEQQKINLLRLDASMFHTNAQILQGASKVLLATRNLIMQVPWSFNMCEMMRKHAFAVVRILRNKTGFLGAIKKQYGVAECSEFAMYMSYHGLKQVNVMLSK